MAFVARISDNRLMHARAVAELMHEKSKTMMNYSDEKAMEMYLLGFIHNIGYAVFSPKEKKDQGADILDRSNYKYSNEIRFYRDPDNDYISEELLLLQYCDLHVMPNGDVVDCNERIDNTKAIYGKDSEEYKTTKKICDRLKKLGYI